MCGETRRIIEFPIENNNRILIYNLNNDYEQCVIFNSQNRIARIIYYIIIPTFRMRFIELKFFIKIK